MLDKLIQRERGVSPVIGVILMISLVVVLAGILVVTTTPMTEDTESSGVPQAEIYSEQSSLGNDGDRPLGIGTLDEPVIIEEPEIIEYYHGGGEILNVENLRVKAIYEYENGTEKFEEWYMIDVRGFNAETDIGSGEELMKFRKDGSVTNVEQTEIKIIWHSESNTNGNSYIMDEETYEGFYRIEDECVECL